MRIQHNQGQFVLNQYNHTNTNLNKTLQKLSSGYKINGAADDAAGLAISQKMEAQIRGLNQAGENIQDGISLINTTESGLGQIQNPNLIRIRELIVQAANDTNTVEERAIIQKEINQIIEGIDDIANNTEFNTIPTLTPDGASLNQINQNLFDIVFLIDDSGTMSEEIRSVQLGLGTFVKNMGQYGDVQVGTVSMVHTGRDLPLTGDADTVIDHINTKHTAVGGNVSLYDKLNDLIDGGTSSNVRFRDGSSKVVVILSDTGDESSSNKDVNALKTNLDSQNIQTYVFGLNFIGDRNVFNRDADYDSFATQIFKPSSAAEISENITPGLANVIVENSGTSETLQKDIFVQAGPNEGQHIKIPLYNNRAAALGLGNLLVEDYDNAMEALKRVDIANNIISERRSEYGALYNRFEHAYNNVTNMEENLTSTLSKLQDADIAKETIALQKDQVLLQSAQSMMVQVNQMSQAMLKLLG